MERDKLDEAVNYSGDLSGVYVLEHRQVGFSASLALVRWDGMDTGSAPGKHSLSSLR